MSVWPSVANVVRAAHGLICSHCVASTLSLPGALVAMTTFGLARTEGFEM